MRARLLSFMVVAAAVGCNDPVYIMQNRPLETLSDGMGGFGDDVALFVVPVRMPSNADMRSMDNETMRLGLMMPVPWAGVRDFDIELQWTVKNLDKQEVDAKFILNGGNEFGDYVPANF